MCDEAAPFVFSFFFSFFLLFFCPFVWLVIIVLVVVVVVHLLPCLCCFLLVRLARVCGRRRRFSCFVSPIGGALGLGFTFGQAQVSKAFSIQAFLLPFSSFSSPSFVFIFPHSSPFISIVKAIACAEMDCGKHLSPCWTSPTAQGSLDSIRGQGRCFGMGKGIDNFVHHHSEKS